MNITIAERNRLVVDNLRLVRFFVKKYRVPPNMQEDAMQAGAMGLMQAIRKYDPKHASGRSLSGYAAQWIVTSILRTTAKARRFAEAEELDERVLPCEGDEDLLLLLSKRRQLQSLLAELPQLQLEIVARRIYGESNEEIGRQLQPRLSRERVRQLERDAYDQIRRIARRRSGPLAEAMRIGA